MKKCQILGNFLTVKWQFSGGSVDNLRQMLKLSSNFIKTCTDVNSLHKPVFRLIQDFVMLHDLLYTLYNDFVKERYGRDNSCSIGVLLNITKLVRFWLEKYETHFISKNNYIIHWVILYFSVLNYLLKLMLSNSDATAEACNSNLNLHIINLQIRNICK